MEEIKCRFCGKPTIYPVELNETVACRHCMGLYEVTLKEDAGETLQALCEYIVGKEFLSQEEIKQGFEYFIQPKFDFLYEDKEEAQGAPERGVEAVLVWVRKRILTN